MNPTQKVSPGDPLRISADAYNSWVDAAIETRNRAAAGAFIGDYSTTSTTVKIQNKSGSGLDRFSILTLGDPVWDADDNLAEFQGNVVYEGNSPAAESTKPVIAILTTALEADAIGRAVVLGAAVVAITVSSGETGYLYAKSSAGATSALVMSNSPAPARVIWKQSGTGVKWAAVLLSQNWDGDGSKLIKVGSATSGTSATSTDWQYDGLITNPNAMVDGVETSWTDTAETCKLRNTLGLKITQTYVRAWRVGTSSYFITDVQGGETVSDSWVQDVSWDLATCTMTKTTKTLYYVHGHRMKTV